MYVSNVIFVLACPSRVEIVLMSIYMRKKIEMSKESSERNFSVKIVVDFFLVLRYNMGGRGSF